MTTKTKLLYIFSIIALAIAACGGGAVLVANFIMPNSEARLIVETVGLIVIVVGWLSSLILDIIYKKITKSKDV